MNKLLSIVVLASISLGAIANESGESGETGLENNEIDVASLNEEQEKQLNVKRLEYILQLQVEQNEMLEDIFSS